jgi:hypothetical protein
MVDLLQHALAEIRMVIASTTRRNEEEHSMMDVLMLALAFGFFALAIGYTYACERL